MEKIYYLSQGETPQDHLKNIKEVCKSGIKLIQLRLKDYDLSIVHETAIRALNICKKYESKLIINDYVDIAYSIKADGVHLGKNDMSIMAARQLLGKNKIIGGTANTFQDCVDLICYQADYIGLGPFRSTQTKKDLNPFLGLEGYSKIIRETKKIKNEIPVYAIGGITMDLIADLCKTGIYGIAVSSLFSFKPVDDIEKMLEAIYKIGEEKKCHKEYNEKLWID